MESNTKRRKLAHGDAGIKHKGLIDFSSKQSSQISPASTFVLQTDELLAKTKLDYAKTLKDVDGNLHALKSAIEAIPAQDPVPISDATKAFERKHAIRIPYPDPKPAADAPYKVGFAKPSQINIVGGYVARTMIKGESSYNVDMIVEMPKDMFQDKDYQNMRYFYRRAYYLAYIAAHVKQSLGEDTVAKKVLLNDNPLLPVLQLQPESKSSYSIRIIPCAPVGLFPTSKLGSNAGSIKPADQDAAKKPSPFYNSTLKAESTYVTYLRVLTLAKKECPAFIDACVLGRIWLRQRGFASAVSRGGFGHFEWAVMIALLLKTGGKKGAAVLSTSLSAQELFKAGIQFLATTDFNKKAFMLGATSTPAEAIKETGPVMYDAARELNILAKMGAWSANLLRMQAQATTNVFADDAAEKFEPSFISRVDGPLQLYDAVFEVKVPERVSSTKGDGRGALWDLGAEAYRVLRRAYGNRASLVHVSVPGTSATGLNKDFSAKKTLQVGIVFDPAHMPRSMEYGPPAEEAKEAAKFRQFWGDKAELRRFKDGSILECVDWSDGPTSTAADLCERIGQYALGHHLKISPEAMEFWGDGVGGVLGLSVHDKGVFDSARKAFGDFERDIRGLDDLPLQIRSLTPISSEARYASVGVPQVGYHQGTIRPMEVNLYFEASSRWPENITAIQEAKIEFLLDIDRRLTAAQSNITTHLGRDDVEIGAENLTYLDVVYETGAAFRVRILCSLEETLLERQVKNKTLSAHVREEAEEILHRINWRFNILPLHTQMVATLCTRLSALSGTIRLVKHWFNSQKLRNHFSEELIELIVLHVFLQPYPWVVPTSESAGFLRTIGWLAKWDWRDEPLIVDSADEMTAEQRAGVAHELRESRKKDPNLNRIVLIVATAHDASGHAYTRAGPSKLIASRMTHLAKAAYKEFHDRDLHFEPEALFETSLQDYDVLFHLSAKAIKGISREAATENGVKKASQFKNLDERTGRVPVPIRNEPVQILLDVISKMYADSLILFAGAPDEDMVVGAIWNPRLQKQKARVGLPYNFIRVDRDAGDDQVDLNRKAVLLEISRIGGEMIRKIEELDDEDEEAA